MMLNKEFREESLTGEIVYKNISSESDFRIAWPWVGNVKGDIISMYAKLVFNETQKP